MSKIEKLEKKLRALPSEAAKEDVFKILELYNLETDTKSGSHIVVRHEKLIGEKNYSIDGEFSIAIKRGRTVKKVYINRIFKAIDIINGEQQ